VRQVFAEAASLPTYDPLPPAFTVLGSDRYVIVGNGKLPFDCKPNCSEETLLAVMLHSPW